MSVISARGLEKRYGDKAALSGVDFTVPKGEIVGFLGPNGAGKTTTMKILTGFISPTAGEAKVCGINVVSDPVAARRKIGYLPESAPVYTEMRVVDYLQFMGQVRGLDSAERAAAVDRALRRCGLTERAKDEISTLSKGYRQRVGLAQAILHEPDLLILDEPTSGLDPNQIAEIRALIRELGERRTVILSTHILSEVQATCDRVLIIHKGRIVADGPTATVTAASQGERLRVVVGQGEVRLTPQQLHAGLAALPGVRQLVPVDDAELVEGELAVDLLSDGDLRAVTSRWVTAQGLTLLEQRRERSNLEEVFRRLTGADDAPARATSGARPD